MNLLRSPVPGVLLAGLVPLILAQEAPRGSTVEAGKPSPEAGPSTTPLADQVLFTAKVTHAYYPLATVRYTELASAKEKVLREVQPGTRVVAGVECTVLAEKEYEEGELKEISYNCFAQDAAGNVYYFGEDVDEYEDGEVVSHGGAWMVGKNATEPCLFLPAQLTVGFGFKPENSPPDAEEWDEIEATDAELVLPAGTFHDVLVIREADAPGQWKERKYYAKGIGLISENRELNLVRAPAVPRDG